MENGNDIFYNKARDLSWLCSASMLPISWIKRAAVDENQFHELIAQREDVIEALFDRILKLKKMSDTSAKVDATDLEGFGDEVIREASAFHEKVRMLTASAIEKMKQCQN